MYRTEFWTLWEKARVGCFERTALKHVYYLGWNRSPAQAGCMRQVLGPGALGRPRGIGRRGKWEGGSGWGTLVNPWLIHVNVWQKPLQYCKVISLQLIKINGKKEKRVLCQLPVGMNWLWGNLGLALVGGAMLSKSLIQSPAEELGYAPSQLIVWPEQCSPGVGLLVTPKRTWANTCLPGLQLPVPLSLQQATSNPRLWSRPSTPTGRSGSVPCGVTAPFPWVLVGTRFCLCL